MPPIRPFDTPTAPDIPVLDDVVIAGDGNPVAPKSPVALPMTPTVRVIDQVMLGDKLAEPIAALTDRLLRAAMTEVQDIVMDKVFDQLRAQIPAIVAHALRETDRSN